MAHLYSGLYRRSIGGDLGCISRHTQGAVGVSLVTVMTFNTTLMSLIKYWTLLETSIGAVSRVKTFVESTESEKNIDSHGGLPPDWPAKGAITFSEVFASHE